MIGRSAQMFRYFVGLRFAQFGLACLVAAAFIGELHMRTAMPEPHATISLMANVALGFTGIAATFTAYETTIQRHTGGQLHGGDTE